MTQMAIFFSARKMLPIYICIPHGNDSVTLQSKKAVVYYDPIHPLFTPLIQPALDEKHNAGLFSVAFYKGVLLVAGNRFEARCDG